MTPGAAGNRKGVPMKKNPLVQLGALGQSPWLDFIERGMIGSGELARLVSDDGIRGVTSNPTIFEKAISGGKAYDGQIRALAGRGAGVMEAYKELVTEVLDRVAEQTGRAAVVAALGNRFDDLSRRLQAELADAPPSRRMEVVMRALRDGGFMAEWHEGEEGGMRLTEHHCAIRAVAERFPEVCEAEVRFLESVLSAEVERQSHMLTGCTSCEYRVEFAQLSAPRRVDGLSRPAIVAGEEQA